MKIVQAFVASKYELGILIYKRPVYKYRHKKNQSLNKRKLFTSVKSMWKKVPAALTLNNLMISYYTKMYPVL